MTDTVDDFDHHPEPRQRGCDRPTAPHWPKEAPRAEGEEQHVEYDETALEVGGYQASDKARGRKRLPEMLDILLDRVGGLSKDQRAERNLEARHT